MADVHNTGSGNWNDASTWKPASVPDFFSNVFLDYSGQATVTLKGPEVASPASVTIGARNTLAFDDGTLSTGGDVVVGAGGLLLARSGNQNVVSADLVTRSGNGAAGTVEVATNATLTIHTYVSAGGNLQIDNGGTLKLIAGTVNNEGDIFLSSTGATTQIGTGSGPLTLTADGPRGGNLLLSDSAANRVAANLTNVNNTVRGAGLILGQLDNQAAGIIDATGTDNRLVLDAGANGSAKNAGLIEASGKAGLRIGNADLALAASRLRNTGVIRANGGSKVVLAHVEVDNSGNGVLQTAGPGGEIDLQDSKIKGGSLGLITGSRLVATGANSLTDIATSWNGSLTIAAGASLAVRGVSPVDIKGDLDTAGKFLFDSALTLGGGKKASVTGQLEGDARLTNVDDVITGTGVIKVGVLSNQAKGEIAGNLRISADQFGNAGTISGAKITSTFATNTGSMSGVSLETYTFDNSGKVSGATFDIPALGSLTNQSKGTIVNSRFGKTAVSNYGAVRADGGETTFSGTQLTGGLLASSNGGALHVLSNPDRGTVLRVNEVAHGTTLVLDDGTSSILQSTVGTLTLDDVAILVNGVKKPTALQLAGTVRLQGGSEVTLGDFTLAGFAGNLLTIGKLANVGSVIEGAGRIAGDAGSSLNNGSGGTIKAGVNNTLVMDVGQLTNDGVLVADGGTLRVETDGAIAGGGFVEAVNGGTVDLLGTRSFRGSFSYVGRGTIIGSAAAPVGPISGFATGDSFVFGQKTSFLNPLTVSWQENAGNTGGVLTIKSSPNDTYATLAFNGVYATSDFTAYQLTLGDGAKHVAVGFTGQLSWAAPVSGNWHTASNWNPTGLLVPGPADDVLITVAGGPYKVTDTEDTTVRTLAMGQTATLLVKAGTLTISQGTAGVANAGTIDINEGAAFTLGGTFRQDSTGRIVADGAGASIGLAGGATIRGGSLHLAKGASLAAASGLPAFDNVSVGNRGAINVTGKTRLALTGGTRITGDGSMTVAAGSTLAIANSTIVGNAVAMAGTLEIDTLNTVLNASVTLEGGRIVAGGSPASLSNRGSIQGNGVIGDANLTLFNLGTLQQSGGGLTIATGAHTVINSGNMFTAPDGRFRIQSAFDNTGTFRATDKAVGEFDSAVKNFDTIQAEGTGPNSDATLDFRDTVSNSGVISAVGLSNIKLVAQVTQSRTGQIQVSDRGRLILNAGSGIAGGSIVLGSLSRIRVDSGPVTIQDAKLSLTGASEIRGDKLTLAHSKVTMDAGSSASMQSNEVLTVQDSTLEGGSWFVRGSSNLGPGRLRIGGKVKVEGATIEVNGGRIVSDGAAAALVNAGTILGRGNGSVGDGQLRLVNDGVVTVANSSGITLDTGSNVIVNHGIIKTSDAKSLVAINSTLQNAADGQVLVGAGRLNAVGIENAGLLQATGTTARIQGTSLLNTGHVVASDGGNVRFDGGVSNGGGELTAESGGKVVVVGAATDGIATIVGDGSTVDFEGSASADTTTRAVFDDGLGALLLNNSDRFAGTVAGFATGDKIDVEDIAFVAGKSFYTVDTGILTISDGGAHTANIQLLGTYSAMDFAFKSDGHNGTLVIGTASADHLALSHV